MFRYLSALIFAVGTAAVDNTAMVSDAIQSAERALQRYEQLSSSSNASPQLTTIASTLTKTGDSIQQITLLKAKQDELIDEINERQLKQFVEKLQNISATEQARRERAKDGNKNDAEANENTVNEAMLRRLLKPESVLQESEAILTEWIASVLQNEAAAAMQGAAAGDCVTTAQAANEVQAALNRYQRDGVGRTDHVAAGATIVHSLTSPTYQPDDQDDATATVGNAWWRKYIPQDWEAVLPTGWEDWRIALPDHLYHTLGMAGRAYTAPPEAILQKSALPGFCWPASMENDAFVTIRLPYAVAVDAVSIDHASHLILPPDKLTSAPKHLKVYGYAPCANKNCADGLGFDIHSKRLLADIHYSIDEGAESNVQTFPVEEKDEERIEEGSCSASTLTSCEGGDSAGTAVAAVRVEIIENWGNPDYTCFYRFRVHGERQ